MVVWQGRRDQRPQPRNRRPKRLPQAGASTVGVACQGRKSAARSLPLQRAAQQRVDGHLAPRPLRRLPSMQQQFAMTGLSTSEVKNMPTGGSVDASSLPPPRSPALALPLAATLRQQPAACSAGGNTSSSSKAPCAPYGSCNCRACMKKNGGQREDRTARIEAMTDALLDFYNELNDKTYSELYAKLNQAIEDLEDGEKTIVEKVSTSVAEAIFLALEEGDLDDIKDFFQMHKIEPHCGPLFKQLASEMIVTCAQIGHYDIMGFLLANKADIETICYERDGTPLMHASYNGHTQVLRLLLDHGAKTEARDIRGFTAIMVAANCDRPSAVEALIQGGANVDALDNSGRTALHYAALYGSSDCINMLVNARADVSIKDDDGFTPLELAQQDNHPPAIEALQKAATKVRLQEKRIARKQEKMLDTAGTHPSAADLEQREREAERRAAELLEELEREATRKKEKVSKKTKQKAERAKEASAPASAAQAEEHEASLSRATTSRASSQSGLAASSNGGAPTPHEGSKALSPEEQLRSQWESLLEEAARCMDEAQQPEMLRRVQELLPSCLELGISVKYGRKVIQRLEGVGPARAALQACLSSPHPTKQEVQAALALAKPVRSLLDASLVQRAEELGEKVAVQQEAARWNNLAAGLSWQPPAEQQAATGRAPLAPPAPGHAPLVQATIRSFAHLAVRPLSQAPNGPNVALVTPTIIQPGQPPPGLRHIQPAAPGAGAGRPPPNLSHLPPHLALHPAYALRPAAAPPHAPPAPAAPPRPPAHPPSVAVAALAAAAAALRSSEVDEENECVICLHAAKSTVCIPCGHVCMCQTCSEDVEKKVGHCPVCRTSLDMCLPIQG